MRNSHPRSARQLGSGIRQIGPAFEDFECNGDFATVRAGSLRIAFVPIIILVGVVLFLVLLFFIWLFSKEDINGHRPVSGL